jgi:hypothetical protein
MLSETSGDFVVVVVHPNKVPTRTTATNVLYCLIIVIVPLKCEALGGGEGVSRRQLLPPPAIVDEIAANPMCREQVHFRSSPA